MHNTAGKQGQRISSWGSSAAHAFLPSRLADALLLYLRTHVGKSGVEASHKGKVCDCERARYVLALVAAQHVLQDTIEALELVEVPADSQHV